MAEHSTKIAPLDPAFHGESNYEVGLEDLLVEKRKQVTELESDPNTTKETLQFAREGLQVLETLWENYHIGMNVFRNAKGGREGIREIKTD
jgi:colicin import membrane protein